jgi:hypothetical protein
MQRLWPALEMGLYTGHWLSHSRDDHSVGLSAFWLQVFFIFLVKVQTSLAFIRNFQKTKLRQKHKLMSNIRFVFFKSRKISTLHLNQLAGVWDCDEFLTLLDTFSNVNVHLWDKLCSND